MLLVVVIVDNAGGVVSSISQTNVVWSGSGNGLQVQNLDAPATLDVEIWLGTVGANAGAVITINLSHAVNNAAAADACEYSGLVSASSVLDKTATITQGSVLTGDTGTTATTTQGQLWVGGILPHAATVNGVVQSNPTNGFSLDTFGVITTIRNVRIFGENCVNHWCG